MKKVAIVTGAAGIIGPAICRALSREGWSVAAADRDRTQFDLAERVFTSPAIGDFQWIGDLTQKSNCSRLVEETTAALGPVSLLVNNAAFAYRTADIRDISEETAINLFRLNTLAPLWLTAAASPSLASKAGTVINISSAHTQGWAPENHLYAASKAALEKLTETLSGTLGATGARCVGIRLGSFPGVHFMQEYLAQLPAEAARNMVKDVMPFHLASTRAILGRQCVGDPTEVGTLICYLASDSARMINGCVFSMDGGMTTRPTPWPTQSDSFEKAAEWFDSWKKNEHPVENNQG